MPRQPMNSAQPETLAGHRNRLRFYEVRDGHLTLEILAELLAPARLGLAVPLGFVREGAGIRPVAPDALPAAAAMSDVTDALARTRLWIMLRERQSGAEAYAATAVQVESTPEIGPARARQFAVRFTALARFDLLAVLAPASAGAWDLFTVLDTVGHRSTAPVGAYRDRVTVDGRLRRAELRPGLWLRPRLTGFGPRLTLEIGR